MIGFFSVNSQITKNTKLISANTPSATITGELNQSRSLPLSSMICNEPTHAISEIRPTLSMGMRFAGVSRVAVDRPRHARGETCRPEC